MRSLYELYVCEMSAGGLYTYLTDSAHLNVSVHLSLAFSIIIYQEVPPNAKIQIWGNLSGPACCSNVGPNMLVW